MFLITAVVIVLGIAFGFAGATKLKDVHSEKLHNRLCHKAGFVGLIALAFVIQHAMQHAELGFDVPSVMAVCVYVIATEEASVFENLYNPLNSSMMESIDYRALWEGNFYGIIR